MVLSYLYLTTWLTGRINCKRFWFDLRNFFRAWIWSRYFFSFGQRWFRNWANL